VPARIESGALTRATLLKLIAAMVVLTIVQSAVMLQIDWNGVQASEEAAPIDTLLDVMIVLSCFVFSIVLVMLGYSIWKYRAKPGDESDGEPIHGNTKLEIAWTVIPTVIVLSGVVYSWIVLDDIEEPAAAADQLRVNVYAQQYKWTFEYPDQNVTSNELHVPVDRQLDLHLTAVDVIHSFWVPEWRLKRDLVPQGPTETEVDDTLLVTPDREGTYSVLCTELCGFGHATMSAPVVVTSEDEFNDWAAKAKRAGGGPPVPQGPGPVTSGGDEGGAS
jgi:cytochrome c oxidase subunit II